MTTACADVSGYDAARRGAGGRLDRWAVLGLALLLTLLAAAPAVEAKTRRVAPSRPAAAPPISATTPAWIVINAASGEELFRQEPDRPGAPASMTKMMLALLTLEAMRDGQLRLSDPVRASRLASKMGGSQVYLKEGEEFPAEEMMAALLIGSANDAAAALAERLTGSVEATVRRMNERAAALRLTQTRFGSVHGLPPAPGQEGDVTTPRDMARLGQELLKFPDVLRWTGTIEAPFRGGAFILRNSNKLVGSVAGVDGFKTGHFREAGYSVAATAKRGSLRLIAVVMGAPTNQARFAEAARLLGEGFATYVEVPVAKAGAPVGGEIRIARSRIPFKPVAAGDLTVHVRREAREQVKTSLEMQSDLRAPLKSGQPVGALVVRLGEREIARTAAVTPFEIKRWPLWWLTPWK